MKIQVTVCDTCQNPDAPTEHYELRSQGKNVKVDLCEEHATPLEAFLADAKPRGRAATKKAASSRGRRSSRVTTMDEIEKQKAGKK